MKPTYNTAVIDVATSHSTKPASGQVAGYPAQAGIQLIERCPRSGTTGLVCCAAFFSYLIPACAGMTVSR